jgi:hypothetical protein
VKSSSKVEPLVPGRTSLISDNSSIVHVDEHIFRAEMIGEINATSTWGNRQAEKVGLSAFSRAKVRTALGQRLILNYGGHLFSERSGYGEIFGRERAFEPHILDIVCSAEFVGWVPTLPDKICEPLPAKFEVCRLIVYCLRRLIASRTTGWGPAYDEFAAKIKAIDDFRSNDWSEHLRRAIAVAHEVRALEPGRYE